MSPIQGFLPKQQRPEQANLYTERLILMPSLEADLTLHERRTLIAKGLGRPNLRVLQNGTPRPADDLLVVCSDYTPFSAARRYEALQWQRNGLILFERSQTWKDSRIPAFDGDGYDGPIERTIGNCLRGVNLLSLLPTTQVVHIHLSIDGLTGSQLIFNPHRYTDKTICQSDRPIQRRESVSLASRGSTIKALRVSAWKLVNEVLNTFRRDDYFEDMSQEELSVIFDAQISRLKFSTGLLMSTTVTPAQMTETPESMRLSR